jgi:hypothetical protein
MMVVPVAAVAAQSFNITLNGQPCTLQIAQKTTGLFMNVLVDNILILAGVLCLDRTLIIRDTYLGYEGDLYFVDTQGTTDPVWTDLGTRYLLISVASDEL